MRGLLLAIVMVVSAGSAAGAPGPCPGFLERLVGRSLGVFGATGRYDKYASTLDGTQPPDPGTVKFLLSSPNEAHRLAAIQRAGVLPEAERYGFLLRGVSDKSTRVRVAAMGELGNLSGLTLDKRSEAPLGNALGDSDAAVREAAVQLLRNRNDPHSLAAIVRALYAVTYQNFNGPSPKYFRWRYPEFLAMKRDALRALEGRTDAGAVDLMDRLLRGYPFLPLAEWNAIPEWFPTVLGHLLYAKEHGTPEVQAKISALVKAREGNASWNKETLELLRTPKSESWVIRDGGGYWGVDRFEATELYKKLVGLPGAPAETEWGWNPGWWGMQASSVRHYKLDPPRPRPKR